MATEKRLIDANALTQFVEERACGVWIYKPDFLWAVAKQPTVDAAEVVHGHMVERTVDHECPWYKVYDCSECGCTVEIWHNYCPNCGAKMDGDGNERC